MKYILIYIAILLTYLTVRQVDHLSSTSMQLYNIMDRQAGDGIKIETIRWWVEDYPLLKRKDK